MDAPAVGSAPASDELAVRLLQYLRAYECKDLTAIEAMLAPDVRLQDWNVAGDGTAFFLAETRKNFEAASSIAIQVQNCLVTEGCAAAQLLITIDGQIELEVVDVLGFDEAGRIASIRAYKG